MSEIIFSCTLCGFESAKWLGQCRECGEWNTFVEKELPSFSTKSAKGKGNVLPSAPSKRLPDIPVGNDDRISTGISELDRALSGGLVRGQVVLLAGNPGIGKSTLVLQLAGAWKGKVLYVSAEESETQLAIRAKRLRVANEQVHVSASGQIDGVFSESDTSLLVIDSIQSVFTGESTSRTGSVSQMLLCVQKCVTYCKSNGVPCVIIGHVTKDGMVAGPKILEHLVDTVCYFEGDKEHAYRLLRIHKNRFGDDSEVGMFEMKSDGLSSIKNPAGYFIPENPSNNSGVAYTVTLAGNRPIILEIQSLVTKTHFGYPKRTANGVSLNKLQLLCAVLEKRMKVPLGEYDVYLNVMAGFVLHEPAGDLAMCASILSAYHDKPLPPQGLFWGEVGLSGEVRSVVSEERRIKEATLLQRTPLVSAKQISHISKLPSYLQ